MKNRSKTGQQEVLRETAEKILSQRHATGDVHKFSGSDIKKIIHELEVHQIELEMQNEELKQAQVELSETKDKYLELYNFSPVAYITLDEKGVILESNLAADDLFKVRMAHFIMKRKNFAIFVSPDHLASFRSCLENIFKTNLKESCEVELIDANGGIFHARLEYVVMQGKEMPRKCQIAVVDIVKQKKQEELLVMSEERYSRILGTITDYLYTVQIKNGRPSQTVYGQGCLAVTGYSAEEFSHDPNLWFKIVFELDRKKVEEWSRDIFENKNAVALEHRIVRKDGLIRWIRNTPVLRRDTSGELICYDGVVKDVTDRKVAEQERLKAEVLAGEILEHKKLEEALQLQAAIMRNLSDAVYLVRCSDGTIVYVNPRFEQVFGYAASEILGRHVIDIETPANESVNHAERELALNRNRNWQGEVKNIKKDGTIIWCYASVSAFLHPDYGEVWISVNTDITEKRKMEEKLAWLASFPELDPLPVVETDASGNISYMNKAAESLIPDLAPAGIKHPWLAGIDKIFETLVREGKREFIREVKIDRGIYEQNIYYDPATQLMRIYAFDITMRRRVAEALQESGRIKSAFTSMVSHELRTPLGAIKEAVSLVSEGRAGSINEEQKNLLILTTRNVNRLARLINHVLDFQKIESGKMTFQMSENDINAVIRETAEIMELEIKKKGLELVIELGADLPKIYFDRDRIIQVIWNLLNNSFKYTGKGSITVTTGMGDNFIQVSVKDTGQGIKEKDMPRLFRRYEQLGRRAGGTGLGLAISEEIIRAHGGKIWAESKFGEGTTMYFVLPIEERRT